MFNPDYAYIARNMPFDKVKNNNFVHATGRIIVGKFEGSKYGTEIVEYEDEVYDDIPTTFYETEEGELEYV